MFFATGCLDDGAVPDRTIAEAPGPAPTSAPVAGVPAGMDLIAGVTERNTSPDANGEAVNAVVAGANEFAVRLFQAAIGEASDNVVVGNHSLSNALFLTMAGTGGDTTDGFADLLGVTDVDSAELHPAVNAIDLILESRSGDGLDLAIANRLFVQHGLELRDEFLDIAVGSYGAPVAAVDFVGAPDEVVTIVNDWVADQTDGFIDELTTGYDPKTVVVLANAMYLKASWAVQFHRLEQPGQFTTINGDIVETEMMSHDEYLPLNGGSDFVAVELPYVGGNLSLVVIQPEDLIAFEADLTAARLAEITEGLREGGIHLTMPVWSTKTSIEALDPLHAIGLPSTYDFSAMIDGGQTDYFIESISHVARIDVDETGTTAGAATDVVIAASHGPTVMIDRPFFYVIRDRGSDAILFMGHVTDPTQSG
ncbi:MAG: serpin family protein [Acidimicrobiia bacterium]